MRELYCKENILILAKTYPNPSAKYLETSCVAGITEYGEMRRLYPVPFRRLDGEYRFKKWQWINVTTEYNTQDNRKESRKIAYESIQLGSEISSANEWKQRIPWVAKIPQIRYFKHKFATPDIGRNITLALFTPQSNVKLDIVKAKSDCWTKEELRKLEQEDQRGFLFEEESKIPKTRLEKIPYDFYYVVQVQTADGKSRELRIKLIDWEVYSLFRNCYTPCDDSWKEKMTAKLEDEMNQKDLKLLLGNLFLHPHIWVVISLIYPPKQSKPPFGQRLLDF